MSTLVTISDGTLSASVDSLGAQLMSVRLDDAEYLWQGDPTWWSRRAPILFPIVGVLRDGCAQSASGPVKLARHGIARLYEHRIVEKTAEHVTFELSDSAETWSAYPYHFVLNMTYAVEDGILTQRYQVRNTGSVDLPFVLGGHPAFKVPVPKNNGSELPDYELAFTRAWTSLGPSITPDGLCDFEHPQRLITDSDSLPLSWELFDRELTYRIVAWRCCLVRFPAVHTELNLLLKALTTWVFGVRVPDALSWPLNLGQALLPPLMRMTSLSTSAT